MLFVSSLAHKLLPIINDAALEASGSLRAGLLEDASGDVLDLGFGTGLNARHYGPRVRRVVAVEPSEPMWKRGEARAAREGRPGLMVERMAAYGETLPVESASIDTIVATFVLCSVRDLDRVLSELARVARPHAKLLLLEHVKNPGRFAASAQRWITPLWRYCLDGCNPGRDLEAVLASSRWRPIETRNVDLPRVPFVVRHALVGRCGLASDLS